MGEVARRLGKPFMPWQQYVADVSLEVDPDTGLLVYDDVGLTVPRQSGKSTLLLSKAMHRGSATSFFGDRQQIVYTAQTRKDARKKFVESYIGDVQHSKTFHHVGVHLGNGDEHLRMPNGSRFGIESTTEKTGHGDVLDEAYVDEAFAQIDNRLEQGFEPAMLTRRNVQTWTVSTAGWIDGSPFLLAKVARGRELVEMGVRDGTAYFEWSAGDDEDPGDPETWRRCMPALGYTVPEGAIARRYASMSERNNLQGFRRAYLNQWVLRDAPSDAVVDPDVWAGLVDEEAVRPFPVAFSVEVSPDRRWSSIGLAGARSDGAVHVQIVQSGKGTAWLPDRLAELVAEWKPVGVAVDPSGPAGSLVTELTGRKIKLSMLSTREYGQACGMFVDRVDAGTLHHSGQSLLAVSLGAAQRRKTGESWVWRGPADTDISPLKAVTIALFVLAKSKKRKRTPTRVVVMR